jgi:triacylglycerol lipase
MSYYKITPNEAAQVAAAVYFLKDFPVIETAFEGTDLTKVFDFSNQASGPGGTQRFTARSGAFEFKVKTGFAVMAMGKKATRYEGHAILICRGTESIYDWLTDGNYATVLGASGTNVHSGFNRTFHDMKDGFAGFLAQNNPRHVHCIGHSLGGALATLAADWLSHSGYGVDLYTFGAPRVGTREFADNLTSRVGHGNIYRVCHSSDPVTLVPVWPYMHAPRPDGECWVCRSASVNPALHRMPTYKTTAESVGSWNELYCSTPTVLLEYSVRLSSVDNMVSALRLGPLLAFNAIVRTICAGLAITLQPGVSVLDQMSMWVEQAANISIDGESLVRDFLHALIKLMGLSIIIPQKIVHGIIRLIFNAFLQAPYNQAVRASAMVFSGVA